MIAIHIEQYIGRLQEFKSIQVRWPTIPRVGDKVDLGDTIYGEVLWVSFISEYGDLKVQVRLKDR